LFITTAMVLRFKHHQGRHAPLDERLTVRKSDGNRPRDTIIRAAREEDLKWLNKESNMYDKVEILREELEQQYFEQRYFSHDTPHRYWSCRCCIHDIMFDGPNKEGLSEGDMEQRRNQALSQLVDRALSQRKPAKPSSRNTYLGGAWENISVGSQDKVHTGSGDTGSDYEWVEY
jgi:hypothetical protein